MKHKLELFHYWRSSSSWRVRWALQHKNITASMTHINLLDGEHKSPSYREINPAGQVPALKVDEETLGDSIAIIEWLEESYVEKPLLPKNPVDRAYVRRMAYLIASGTQPIQNLSVMRHVSDEREKQVAWARHWIANGLETYERALEQGKSSGSFTYKNIVTMADLCLVPQCYNAERFGVDLSSFPILAKINQNCLLEKNCQDSHPDCFEP